MPFSKETPAGLEVAATPAEWAGRIFSDADISDEEYVMALIGLAENRAAETGCRDCGRNARELAAKARTYFSAKAGGEAPVEECLLPYYNARRICAEEVYVHFYGSDGPL